MPVSYLTGMNSNPESHCCVVIQLTFSTFVDILFYPMLLDEGHLMSFNDTINITF